MLGAWPPSSPAAETVKTSGIDLLPTPEQVQTRPGRLVLGGDPGCWRETLAHLKSLLVALPQVAVSAAAESPAETTWRQIAPRFSPPSSFAGDYGRFRSPLKFYDGEPVKTAADWQRRRQEILTRWHSMMGTWPPVIERPKVEILRTERREDFVQHRIRFEWLPHEMTDGYLLVPEGEAVRPAVLVVYYEPETAIGLGKELRDFAYQLTKRGFVTLSMGNRVGVDNKTYAIYYPSKEKALRVGT